MGNARARKQSVVFSPELGDLTSVFGKLAGKQRGRLRSIRCSGLSLPTDFQRRDSSRTSGTAERAIFVRSIASQRGSHAKISRCSGRVESAKVLRVSEAACSGKSFVSSANFAPNGWSLKTSLGCSLSTMVTTLRRSSLPCPTSGMWASGECLMLRISESPKLAEGFSWSRVLVDSPPWTCWLMPLQWKQYLARLRKSPGHVHRMHTLDILLRLQTPRAGSIWGVRFSWLKRTDGIRWLSGKECLSYMGFPADWMTPTFSRVMRQETQLSRPLQSGLQKS